MSKNLNTFAIGFGLYYLLRFIVAFYPAFVVCFYIYQDILVDDPGEILGASIVGGINFFLWYFCILWLIGRTREDIRTWWTIIVIYLVTLHPFIQIVKWIWHTNENGVYTQIVWPGFDWVPFFFN